MTLGLRGIGFSVQFRRVWRSDLSSGVQSVALADTEIRTNHRKIALHLRVPDFPLRGPDMNSRLSKPSSVWLENTE